MITNEQTNQSLFVMKVVIGKDAMLVIPGHDFVV
jgi:hypothetical protein